MDDLDHHLRLDDGCILLTTHQEEAYSFVLQIIIFVVRISVCKRLAGWTRATSRQATLISSTLGSISRRTHGGQAFYGTIWLLEVISFSQSIVKYFRSYFSQLKLATKF